jgi:hypothetical protein
MKQFMPQDIALHSLKIVSKNQIFVMKTNLMHYLSLIYFIKQLLHVSGVFIAQHQEVFTVHLQQLVRVVRLGDWQLAQTCRSCLKK